ncbi:hypothetical protein A2160_00450 [Candidatus Beckwithbacteria bacterium RBG_13_42_9]|uniref:Lysine decarboxylase n=1 Tax=Candidatus Beckwithbacteria bacterium RBG_13_42_9 TaxID=1797457 RepID=A0A1F5E3Z3_9BACT|nr:MAG: hypothetical protein A2160_00450 [Candidatus Beckwithbacteria bacterium RBG_13_42_9]
MIIIKNLSFFGSSEARPSSPLYKDAFNLAKILASKGYTIVNGGGPGVMDASTQGAQSVKGETISVTFYPEDAPGFEGRYAPNVTKEEIKTKSYIERMFKLMEHGDCYIIFKGGTGTLSEFATAWCLARLYYGHHKPIILYGNFWHKIVKCFKETMLWRGNEDRIVKIVNSPTRVLQVLNDLNKELAKRSQFTL